MKIQTQILAASLVLACLTAAATAESPLLKGERPLAYQVALQGDRALAQIERQNWRAVRQLKPMPLEWVVREDTELALK